MEINQVIALDPSGWLPNLVKNAVAKRLANIGLQIADYVMHGIIPPKMF